MLFLASQPDGVTVPFREIARAMDVPQDFLAKILKTLTRQQLVASTRGARGGYTLAKPAGAISFLDVIEAVEGPVSVNLCTEKHTPENAGCTHQSSCTMLGVWRVGQERMLEVYRSTKLDRLAMKNVREQPHATAKADMQRLSVLH